MQKLHFIIFVICLIGMITGDPYNTDKYYDREIVRQVANWLIQGARNDDPSFCNLSAHKRNSEIITSILGLPKNLNDAGRK